MALVKRHLPADPPQVQPEVGREGLVGQLQDPHPDARWRAARSLADDPTTAGTLCARLAQEADHAVQGALLTALIGFDSLEAAQGLIPLLRSSEAGLRNAVVEALQRMPKAAGPLVEPLLTDADRDIRIFAIDILHELRPPGAAAWLERLLEQDSDVNVCAAAVNCLADMGTSESVPSLRAVIERFPREPFLLFAARAAIRLIAAARTA